MVSDLSSSSMAAQHIPVSSTGLNNYAENFHNAFNAGIHENPPSTVAASSDGTDTPLTTPVAVPTTPLASAFPSYASIHDALPQGSQTPFRTPSATPTDTPRVTPHTTPSGASIYSPQAHAQSQVQQSQPWDVPLFELDVESTFYGSQGLLSDAFLGTSDGSAIRDLSQSPDSKSRYKPANAVNQPPSRVVKRASKQNLRSRKSRMSLSSEDGRPNGVVRGRAAASPASQSPAKAPQSHASQGYPLTHRTSQNLQQANQSRWMPAAAAAATALFGTPLSNQGQNQLARASSITAAAAAAAASASASASTNNSQTPMSTRTLQSGLLGTGNVPSGRTPRSSPSTIVAPQPSSKQRTALQGSGAASPTPAARLHSRSTLVAAASDSSPAKGMFSQLPPTPKNLQNLQSSQVGGFAAAGQQDPNSAASAASVAAQMGQFGQFNHFNQFSQYPPDHANTSRNANAPNQAIQGQINQLGRAGQAGQTGVYTPSTRGLVKKESLPSSSTTSVNGNGNSKSAAAKSATAKSEVKNGKGAGKKEPRRKPQPWINEQMSSAMTQFQVELKPSVPKHAPQQLSIHSGKQMMPGVSVITPPDSAVSATRHGSQNPVFAQRMQQMPQSQYSGPSGTPGNQMFGMVGAPDASHFGGQVIRTSNNVNIGGQVHNGNGQLGHAFRQQPSQISMIHANSQIQGQLQSTHQQQVSQSTQSQPQPQMRQRQWASVYTAPPQAQQGESGLEQQQQAQAQARAMAQAQLQAQAQAAHAQLRNMTPNQLLPEVQIDANNSTNGGVNGIDGSNVVNNPVGSRPVPAVGRSGNPRQLLQPANQQQTAQSLQIQLAPEGFYSDMPLSPLQPWSPPMIARAASSSNTSPELRSDSPHSEDGAHWPIIDPSQFGAVADDRKQQNTANQMNTLIQAPPPPILDRRGAPTPPTILTTSQISRQSTNAPPPIPSLTEKDLVFGDIDWPNDLDIDGQWDLMGLMGSTSS